jgi:hypothetical protein
MEMNLQKQGGKFKNAMICNIGLKDNTETQMIIFFNLKEVNFEELNIGIKQTLKSCPNVQKFKNSIINKDFKEIISFQEYDKSQTPPQTK